MIARFCDGPLDGVEIELAKTIDKVLIVLDDEETVVRYECDVEECLADYAHGDNTPDCLLHLSSLPESYDQEVVELLWGPNREDGQT
jgi:hypothetical protein